MATLPCYYYCFPAASLLPRRDLNETQRYMKEVLAGANKADSLIGMVRGDQLPLT